MSFYNREGGRLSLTPYSSVLGTSEKNKGLVLWLKIMFPFNYKDSDFKHLQYTHWKMVLGCASQTLYEASLKHEIFLSLPPHHQNPV